MVDLPYDIWQHIASFLSKDILWYLRFLNQSLYEIAMDSYYKNVVVSLDASSSSKQYRRDFLRFRDKNIARRVREIKYVSYGTTDFPSPDRTSKSVTQIHLPPAMKARFQHILQGDKKFVVDTIGGFTHVQTMSVEFIHGLREKIFRDSIPLLHTTMHSSSAFLQSLTFSFPFENAKDIIPSSLFLPQLLSLSMTLVGLEETKFWEVDGLFANVAETTILPFLNRHRLTLASLELPLHNLRPPWAFMTSPEIMTNFNLTPLFQGLKHIIHLKSVSFSVSQPTEAEYVARFLSMHSETLQRINIHMTDPTMQSADGVLDRVKPHFPRLSLFSIGYLAQERVAQELGRTAEFVIKISPSLTSLKIFMKPLSHDGVFALFSPGGRTEMLSYAKLSYLNINLQSLTPDLLHLFASCLPNLQEFELYIRKFKRRHTSPETMNEEYEFCLEMGRQNYGHWNLKEFVLSLSNRPRNASGPQKSYGSVAVVGAMPALERFNGQSRKQYMLEARPFIAALPQTQQATLFLWD